MSDSDRLTRIETIIELGLQKIEDRIEGLEHRLFGNGQPGEIAIIKNDISQLKEYRAAEASKSAFSWRLFGGLTVVVTILVAIMEFILHAFKKG